MDTVTVQDNGGGVVGCYIPPSTFNALIQVKSLPSTLSFLFDQKGIDIKAFVSSLIANCISSLKKAGETTMEDADKKLELVLSLVSIIAFQYLFYAEDAGLNSNNFLLVLV
jgi:hypothetical protein